MSNVQLNHSITQDNYYSGLQALPLGLVNALHPYMGRFIYLALRETGPRFTRQRPQCTIIQGQTVGFNLIKSQNSEADSNI